MVNNSHKNMYLKEHISFKMLGQCGFTNLIDHIKSTIYISQGFPLP